MNILKISVIKRRAFVCQILFLFLFCGISETSWACLDLPTTPPDMCIDSCVGVDDLIYLRFKDYATYGANPGEYCACALNIPSTIGTVIAASIVQPGTNTPINGWSFSIDPDTQFPPGSGWQGLSSAVSQAIPAGLSVDVIFCIEPRCEQNPPGQSCCSNVADQILQNASGLLIGTGGANEEGVPDHHISVIGINDVVVVPVATCNDNIMNGDETGVDCGGSDCPACPIVECMPNLQDVLLEVDRDMNVHGNTLFDKNVAIGGDLCVIGQILNPSDVALKHKVIELDECLDAINELKPVRYHFKQDAKDNLSLPSGPQIGLLAQDVETVFPDCVDEQTINGKTIKTINYTQLIPVLISSVQELNQDLIEKEREIEVLSLQVDEINKLKRVVARLSQKIEDVECK